MSRAITLEIPDAIAEHYATGDELKRTIFEHLVLNEFQKGLLSIGQSAQLLGLTYEGFIELLGEHKLSFITATPQELEESYRDGSIWIARIKGDENFKIKGSVSTL